jgi:hypothetical protein
MEPEERVLEEIVCGALFSREAQAEAAEPGASIS